VGIPLQNPKNEISAETKRDFYPESTLTKQTAGLSGKTCEPNKYPYQTFTQNLGPRDYF
jgi:hypothetical protein